MNKRDRLAMIAARYKAKAGAYAARPKVKRKRRLAPVRLFNNWSGYQCNDDRESKHVLPDSFRQHREKPSLAIRTDDHEESPLTRAARLILGKKWYRRDLTRGVDSRPSEPKPA